MKEQIRRGDITEELGERLDIAIFELNRADLKSIMLRQDIDANERVGILKKEILDIKSFAENQNPPNYFPFFKLLMAKSAALVNAS